MEPGRRNAIAVNPFECRMWQLHERLEDTINERSCRQEIESVAKHGQMLPVLGRPLKDCENYKYELIYGARRLFVARYLNVPLLAEIRELSDNDAIIALDIENRHRSNFSPYERALSYRSWLRSGAFASQDELAHALDISPSQVSRLLRLAQLPPVLLNAFRHPTEICETWGQDLMLIWEDDNRRGRLIARARAIARSPRRPPAAAIFRLLLATESGSRKIRNAVRAGQIDEVVKDDSGKPLYRIRAHRREIALLLPVLSLSEQALAEIKAQVASVLQRELYRVREVPRAGAGDEVPAENLTEAVVGVRDLGNLRRTHLPSGEQPHHMSFTPGSV